MKETDQTQTWAHKFRSTFLLPAVVLLLSSSASVAEELSPTQQGAELAQKMCARCHSVEITGASPFPDAPPFREFAGKWPLESLEEALAEGIVVGHPAMPEFMLEPKDTQNLLSYLATLS